MNFSKLTRCHGALSTGVVPVEALGELLVQVHVRWETGDLVLLEHRHVNHVVEQEAKMRCFKCKVVLKLNWEFVVFRALALKAYKL